MGSRSRVLVVDDEPAIRALVAKIVERAGFDVDSARDGEEAMRMLAEHEYSVLVIDLMMPRVDGFTLVGHVRDQVRPQPAVIVITAGDSSATRRLDPSAVHSIVRKPFDINELGDLIEAAAHTIGAERMRGSGEAQVLPFRKSDEAC